MAELPTTDDVMAVLRGVIDPELGSDIVDLGMAKRARVTDDGQVTVTIALTTMGCPLRAQIRDDVTVRIESMVGVTGVTIDWTELDADEKAETMMKARAAAADRAGPTAVPASARVLAVASGKGGVGKSSVTVNLATALARRGLRVGVLDADIGGFSIPRMLGLDGRLDATKVGERAVMTPHSLIVPASDRPADDDPAVAGVTDGRLDVVSMGFLVDAEDAALMWRGLMLNRAVQHFLEDVAWADDLDYLLIDMPPGTGDIAMGLARMLPRAEALVVTTPATAAQKVAGRAVDGARKSHLRVAGIIENMAAFVTPDGATYPLFGEGGGQALSDESGVPLLASIPLEPSVSAGGDAGSPVAGGSGPAADAFRALAARIVDEVAPPVAIESCSARLFDAVEAALDEAGL
ncbi:MAG: Mrp/NBP35 family ATP-binding protein [Acidimicrobiales bacterium]